MSGMVEYLDLNKILFNDKPISYFNTIKTVSSENSVKLLLQNTITKCIDCSNTLFLLFLAKYITEQFGYN